MGRIIFDPKAFAPQYVAPRLQQREQRSRLDPFLTPSGLAATAGLVGMLGKLRLPEGLRDSGVDADAAAMRQAASARMAARSKIEQDRQTYEREREEYMRPDREVLTQAANVSAEDMQTARENQMKRARMEANRAFQQGDDAKAREILMQAGDRIGLASMQMTSGERRRRQVQKQRQDTDRLGRMVEPRQTAAEQRTNVRRKDFRGLGEEAMAPGATGVSGDQYAAALNEAVRLAKEEAPTDKGLGQPVGTSFAGDYEFGGIRLEDFKTQDDGTPGPKVKGLTRAQIRDLMIEWKEGGKAKALKAASETGQDVAEINAFEELLHRELRRKAREEQPKFSVPEPVSAIQQDELERVAGEEAYEAFLKEKRAEDPYYGMRPEDAINQIYIDAAAANTDDKQLAIKQALAKYEPKARTFGDLFIDSRQSRVMKHLANIDKIFPDVDEPMSALDQAKLEKINLENDKLKQALRGLPRAHRQNKMKRQLKIADDNIKSIAENRYDLPRYQRSVQRIGKFANFDDQLQKKIQDSAQSGIPITLTQGQRKQLTKEESDIVDGYNSAQSGASQFIQRQQRRLKAAGLQVERGDLGMARRLIDEIISDGQQAEAADKSDAEKRAEIQRLEAQLASMQGQ